MLNVGIDTAAFYTSHYFLSSCDLAKARGVDTDKYTVGLGVNEMAVSPPDEDIITLAANAAKQVLTKTDPSKIHTVLFATESGIDQSKAAGIYVHKLLNLPKHCRIIELKQACYSGTGAIQMAAALVRQQPDKNVLVLMADIARYGLNTSGESSQGGGAIAMIISADPRLLILSPHAGYACEDVMDFWRPNYRDEALVDGKYSVEVYLKLMKECWHDYALQSGLTFEDHHYFLFHIPFPRLAEKAYQKLRITLGKGKANDEAQTALQDALCYSRTIGNCYTASLYIGLLSLLDNSKNTFENKRIGFYSYGSGCVGEFFSGIVSPDYRQALHTEFHQKLLTQRKKLDVATYEAYYQFSLPHDGSALTLPKHETGEFRLAEIKQHKRIYKPHKS